ncbi:hypothetical protein [Burkholderia cenocepacia]
MSLNSDLRKAEWQEAGLSVQRTFETVLGQDPHEMDERQLQR